MECNIEFKRFDSFSHAELTLWGKPTLKIGEKMWNFHLNLCPVISQRHSMIILGWKGNIQNTYQMVTET